MKKVTKTMIIRRNAIAGACLAAGLSFSMQASAASDSSDDVKKALITAVEAKAKQAQVMNDMIFSFGELGFQETETSKYLTDILRQNGFTIEQGISGIPTAWMATWGSGEPVIALGSDIDGIPKASQKPGVAYHDPLIKGAPGHGEAPHPDGRRGAGQPAVLVAAPPSAGAGAGFNPARFWRDSQTRRAWLA